jgi:hypothetical protein
VNSTSPPKHTAGSAGTAAAAQAAAPKPRAKRPAAARKAVVISDSEDLSDSEASLQLDDDNRWRHTAQIPNPETPWCFHHTVPTHYCGVTRICRVSGCLGHQADASRPVLGFRVHDVFLVNAPVAWQVNSCAQFERDLESAEVPAQAVAWMSQQRSGVV